MESLELEASQVINLDFPDLAKSYVHRIGRTARAGNGGVTIAFCDSPERNSLKAIERLMKRPLPVAGGEHRPSGFNRTTEEKQSCPNRDTRPRKRLRNRRNARKAAQAKAR